MRRHNSFLQAARGTRQFVLLVWLLLGLAVVPARAFDPVLQQAQQKLLRLGYDLGVADGLYGPRTRQALESFQREQQLGETGLLNAETLHALDRVMSPTAEDMPPVQILPPTPLHTVLHYLRLYADYPAQVLPYITANFLGGKSPQEWLEHTLVHLRTQGYAYESWKVQRLEVTDTQAIVEVEVRLRMQQQEVERREIFTVVQTSEDEWLIDAWHIMPSRQDETALQSGS